MVIRKRIRRLVSFFLSFSLIFQSIAPGIILAQEIEVTPAPTEAPAPVTEVTPTPTAEISPVTTPEPTPDLPPFAEDIPSPTPEATPTLTLTPTVTPDSDNLIELNEIPTPVPTPQPIWTEIDSDTLTTTQNVGEGVEYRFKDSGLIINFTKVTSPGKLTIKQIKLTPEQIAATGALSEIAYDITSDMENGSFVYDLTLPIPENQTDVEVKYSETIDNVDVSQSLTQIEEISTNTVTIRNLNHFSVYFVASGRDQAADGLFCLVLGSACGFNATERESLKFDDDNRLETTEYILDNPGFWPDSGYSDSRFVQFNFSPQIPNGQVIENAYIKIIYKTNSIDTADLYGAKLTIRDGNWKVLADTIATIGPNATTAEQTYLIPLPAKYLNRQDLNNLRIRFSMFASPVAGEGGVGTDFDLVNLLVNVDVTPPATPNKIGWTNENPPIGSDLTTGSDLSNFRTCGESLNYSPMTNIWEPVPDAAGYDREVYSPENNLIYSHSLTNNYVNGGGVVDGNTYSVRLRAYDAAGNKSDWSPKCSIRFDSTRPSADLVFPTPGNSSNSFQVIYSEDVNPGEVINPSNYFLTNWPGAGGSGDLSGDATVTYDESSRTATINFINPGWYISAEQLWGVQNIHDLAGNILSPNPTVEYSTTPVSPFAPGLPLTSPDPTNSLIQLWGWSASTDPGGINASGIKGYWYQTSTLPSWSYLGNILTANTYFSTDGTYQFSVKAEDKAGNFSDSTTGEVTIDRTGPLAPTFEFPANGQYFKTQPILNRWSSVTDPSGIKEYRVEYDYDDGHSFANGPYRSTTSTSRSHTPSNSEQGGVMVRVQALDNAGNYGDWSDWVHYFYDATAPTATVDYSTLAPTNGSVIATLVPSEVVTVTSEGGITHTFTENGSFLFTFTDLAGNTGSVTATVSNIDTTPPDAPNPLTPADHATIKGVSFSQTWSSISDAVLYEYQSCYNNPDLGPACSQKYKSTHTSPSKFVAAGQPNSHFWWRVRAKDAVGNWSNYSPSFELVIDNSAPSAPTDLATLPNPTNSFTQLWTWTDSVEVGDAGLKQYWYRIGSGGPTSIGLVTGFTTFLTEGEFDFSLWAEDNSGNLSAETSTTVIVDDTDPESVITSPVNDGTNSVIYDNDWDGLIEGTASDNLSGLNRVEISIRRNSDGRFWTGDEWVDSGEDEPRVTATGTESWNYNLPEPGEDTYEIVSHAVDNAGNIESSYTITIVQDQTIPEVAITLDPTTPDSGNGWYKTDPTITLSATDDKLTDYIEFQWNGSTGTWSLYSAPFKTPGEGNHILYYRAFDMAGNVSGLGIKSIKYDKTELEKGPLNVSVSPNPTSGNTAKVKWEEAKDNVGIEKYEINWSLDGTGTSYTDSVGNMDREHEISKLDQEGKWNIKVTAFDSAGNSQSGSAELIVDRTAPSSPTLSLVGTGVGEATLSWTTVEGATDYIIWYGNNSGEYLFGARVGKVASYTVRGLGAGDYYFVVKSVDGAGNQSSNSNEVSTISLVGAPGIEPGTPAEGFSDQVQGASTDTEESITPTPEVLGEEDTASFPWWLIPLLILTGGVPLWLVFRRR